ncbi:MAG: DUF2087 domain-containing protein [Peptococcaceae bacterium]|jgi:hypothetical protein|nr:DUF2087 domain-containing protein [Peptococcaceae bacterium]
MDREFLEKELKNFLDADGRLKGYPAKNRLKILSLFYLASKLEQGKRYPEKELNQILRDWHTFEDWAMLRRDLYDKRFLDREQDCTFYWLEENQPTLEIFGL